MGLFTPNFGDFVKLGLHVANPIICRLVPSPSRFETRQWFGNPVRVASMSRLSRKRRPKTYRRGSRILKWGVNFCNNVLGPVYMEKSCPG